MKLKTCKYVHSFFAVTSIFKLFYNPTDHKMKNPTPETIADDSIKAKSTARQRFNNVIKRVTFGVVMISGFLIIIFLGPVALIMLIFAIQISCFREILKIGYNSIKIPPSVPYFRSLCWYFYVAANYFFCLETIPPHFQDHYKKYYYLRITVKYHRFISFCMYFIGIVLFVLSLVRKYDMKQFRILGWTHTLLIIIVLQSYLMVENTFTGLIWLIVPASLVILNDIFAYVFGRLWGRTPLIKLSPNKTWEGFVGGIVGTFISGFMLSSVLCKYKYFVCPIEYHQTEYGLRKVDDCTLGYWFKPQTYHFGPLFSVDFYPFTWHFLSFALFASIIAPFGGFCASGFKRAFKVKDFADVIPGHGGVMDRFDCQYLMATFVNVYVFTFVKNPSVDLLFDKILYMSEDSQIEFYSMLKESLEANNILNSTLIRI